MTGFDEAQQFVLRAGHANLAFSGSKLGHVASAETAVTSRIATIPSETIQTSVAGRYGEFEYSKTPVLRSPIRVERFDRN